jgi:hypothetical protein
VLSEEDACKALIDYFLGVTLATYLAIANLTVGFLMVVASRTDWREGIVPNQAGQAGRRRRETQSGVTVVAID